MIIIIQDNLIFFYHEGARWTNIALNKPTYSRSIRPDSTLGDAVDGNTDPVYYGGSCFHSGWNDDEPWWVVNLGAPAVISWVRLTNRLDCCGNI